jgi:hypothetical protein
MALRVVRGRILVLACLDNLIKGAAGVAVQNLNLMLGCPEESSNRLGFLEERQAATDPDRGACWNSLARPHFPAFWVRGGA